MMQLLEGKNAIVTGANRGLGRAITEVFAQHAAGGTIFACCRSGGEAFEEDMEKLKMKYGCKIVPVYFDLCNSTQMKEAIKKIRNEKKNIDILVNNAGVLSDYKRFTMMPLESVRECFDVDFFGQMELTQLVSRLMLRNKGNGGSIIYISSIAAEDGFFSSYDYVASKAAINAAMKQQAREFGVSGIRVNAVAPGIVKTDMIKDSNVANLNSILPAIMLGRFGKKEEIANAVLFLASDLASYITGQVLRVDGGTNPPKANW